MSRALWNAGVWKMWMGEDASWTLDTGLLAQPYAASSRRMPTEIHHQLGLMELTGFLGESRLLVTGAISQISSGLRGHRDGGCRLQAAEGDGSLTQPEKEGCAKPLGGASVFCGATCSGCAPGSPRGLHPLETAW